MDCKAIRSWTLPKVFVLVAGVVALGGLGGCDVSGFKVEGEEGRRTVSASDLEVSAIDMASRLSLVGGGASVRLGQKDDSALVGEFQKPERAVNLTELPPGFGDGFQALGWETAERTVSLVSKDGAVVLALDTRGGLDSDRAERIVGDYIRAHGEPTSRVSSESADYWFWQDLGVRLMVCRYRCRQSGETVTAAVGLTVLMDALRMDEASAQRDSVAADALLKGRPVPLEEQSPADGAGISEL